MVLVGVHGRGGAQKACMLFASVFSSVILPGWSTAQTLQGVLLSDACSSFHSSDVCRREGDFLPLVCLNDVYTLKETDVCK